jgi:ADP-heptose:LPS heptosyltransferase
VKGTKNQYNYYNRFLKRIQSVIETIVFRRESPFVKKNTLLLLKLDSIGDYVLFHDYIKVLKESEKYKNYEITLCGNHWWKSLAEELDAAYVKNFIWVDYFKLNASFLYRFRMYSQIHRRKFETLVHPTYSRCEVSDRLVKYSGIKKTIGNIGDLTNYPQSQKAKNDLFYSELIPSKAKYEFEFYRNRDFFEELLAEKIPLLRPQINYANADGENKIVFCPGAKDLFRLWSAENVIQLSEMLKPDFPAEEFVICGSEKDSNIAKEIINNSSIKFTDYTGMLDLMGLVKVLSQAKLVVTNDSGPFHIAVALNKKVVCISNGNNYGRFSPYPKEMNTNSVVIYPDEVLNCNSEEERLQTYCKHGSTLDINTISASVVYNKIKTSLIQK